MVNGTPVKSLSEYLEKIKFYTNELEVHTNYNSFVFRGETKDYTNTAGQPNLFRPDHHKRYKTQQQYEKNILDEIKVNKITNQENYLNIAIDAQHGGFPSRLLDVTFNSLTALFFATTPHYSQDLYSYDKKVG